MRIWLNQIDGTSQQVSVSSLQELLQLYQNEASRLVCQGAHLSESNFADLLQEGCNVYVNGDLEGGKKKKKKKVYTTKKKNKHIHKRVKMGIYTLYSVDGTSSLIQARVTSPSNARPVPLAVPAPSWLSIGIDTTVASATPPSRWTLKPSRRTRKS